MHRARLAEVHDGDDVHAGGVALQALVDPVVVAVENYRDQVAGGPLLGALLEELEEVLALFVAAQEVH